VVGRDAGPSRGSVQRWGLIVSVLLVGFAAIFLAGDPSSSRSALDPHGFGADPAAKVPEPLPEPDDGGRRVLAQASGFDTVQQPLADTETRALVVRVLTSDDRGSHRPRARTRVRLARNDGAALGEDTSERETGLLGEALWKGLASGSYRVSVPGLVAGRTVELAEAHTETVFVLSNSTTVRGVVLSTAGTPVAGASLWLGEYNSDTQGSVITVSDAAGAFEFETQLLGTRRIGALAEGYAPSALESLERIDGARPRSIRVDFELAPGGRTVAGRVENTSGEPLEGAVVRLKHFGSSPAAPMGTLPTRTYRLHPSRECRTSVDGTFRFSGVAEVGFEVWAVHAGYAQDSAGTERGPLDPGAILLRLEPEARIEGLVVDTEGLPLEGVSVGVGRREAPGGRWVQTNRAGRYVLDGLGCGEHRVRYHKRGYVTVESIHALGAGQSITGPLTHLEPQEGRRIYGTIEPSAPWAGGSWGVRLKHEGKVATTVALDGTFGIWPWAPDEAELEVLYEPGSDAVALRTHVAGLSEEPLLLEVPTDRLRSTLVRGQVVGATGKAPARYRIIASAHGLRTMSCATTALEDGAFSIRLPARGSWRLVVEDAHGKLLHARALPELVGDVLDLGELLLDAPGLLRIELAEGGLGSSYRFSLEGAGGPIIANAAPAAWPVIELATGEYQVVESLGGTTLGATSVLVRAGGAVTVTLGAHVQDLPTLRVEFPDSVGASAWIELRDGGGRVLYSGAPSTLGVRGRVWSVRCPPGEHRLQATLGLDEYLTSRVNVAESGLTRLDLGGS
jgi:hypothetical protein